MTPVSTDCIPEQLQFKKVDTLPLIVNFQGETVTIQKHETLDNLFFLKTLFILSHMRKVA